MAAVAPRAAPAFTVFVSPASVQGPRRPDRLFAQDRLIISPAASRGLLFRRIAHPRLIGGRISDASRVSLVVSLSGRTLSLIEGQDTVYRVPVAVASGLRLVYAGQAWRFQTPNGQRQVLRKVVDPVWTPPDWHYAEAASEHGLRLARLAPGGVALSRSRRLEVRGGLVGLISVSGRFLELPTDEHIVFDGTLFIPPIGTKNRRLAGDLGRYALDLGQGYMIHGTEDDASIGQAATHGCIRVGDDDLAWLFANVPVGTRVVIR